MTAIGEAIMPRDKLGPCALSRCSIEWLLTVGSLGMAFTFLLFPEGMAMRDYLLKIPHFAAIAIPLTWFLSLLLVGIFQLSTLVTQIARPCARLAAVASGIVWIYIGVSVVAAGLLLLSWPCVLMIGGNLYVASMFKS